MKIGHRQQKKAETRLALIKSAFELFAEKGYDKTTIADIAAQANCAPRTFFLYFESKEALLPTAIQQASDSLQDFMLHRGSFSVPDALDQWLRMMLKEHQGDQRQRPFGKGIAFQSRRKFHTSSLMQPVLASEFAKDLNTEAADPEPQLLAAMAVTLFDVFDFDFSDNERAEFMDKGISFLKAGIKTL